MISAEFKRAVKTSPFKAYEVAHKAGLHPSTLSKIVSGIERIKPGDLRVLRVAEIIGIEPEECFEKK